MEILVDFTRQAIQILCYVTTIDEPVVAATFAYKKTKDTVDDHAILWRDVDFSRYRFTAITVKAHNDDNLSPSVCFLLTRLVPQLQHLRKLDLQLGAAYEPYGMRCVAAACARVKELCWEGPLSRCDSFKHLSLDRLVLTDSDASMLGEVHTRSLVLYNTSGIGKFAAEMHNTCPGLQTFALHDAVDYVYPHDVMTLLANGPEQIELAGHPLDKWTCDYSGAAGAVRVRRLSLRFTPRFGVDSHLYCVLFADDQQRIADTCKNLEDLTVHQSVYVPEVIDALLSKFVRNVTRTLYYDTS